MARVINPNNYPVVTGLLQDRRPPLMEKNPKPERPKDSDGNDSLEGVRSEPLR